MKAYRLLLFFGLLPGLLFMPPAFADNPFAAPKRGFTSEKPASDWQQCLLTGNGTMGALVTGDPYTETLYLSHASLYLPNPESEHYIDLASRLEEIRQLCLAGNYGKAGGLINVARNECSYHDQRDPFIAACAFHIRQPPSNVKHYQRKTDFMTAETSVTVEDERGIFQRSAFVSRPDNVIVLRLSGSGKHTADFSFAALLPGNESEKKIIDSGLKSSEQGVKDGFLYFRTLFANQNQYNPNIGYEVVGKVIVKGGTTAATAPVIKVADADEILVLIKIQPLLKADGVTTNLAAIEKVLNGVNGNYDALLASQAKIQDDLMGRVSLSLNAPESDRIKSSEQLNSDSRNLDAPLAKIERAFDAGRYNIICSTGLYPPNLQGLWSATWLAPWSGSFTTNGNLPAAVAFLLMGNTPELMQPYFCYYDDRMAGFRTNAKAFFGTRGFLVPAQLTLSPRETDFNASYPHCYWTAGAAWACQFYYDYYQYTGDEKFLKDRAYPIMKEAAAFYEDFLTVKDKNGKLVFLPDFSPENAPGGDGKPPISINATMDVSAAKQLLRNSIAAAKLLGCDLDLQKKWAKMIANMPDYEVGPDGSFREWLWPGEEDNNPHRHASNLYALYDERPAEIVGNPDLVKAVNYTLGKRTDFYFHKSGFMAFGLLQNGLAAAHIGNADLTQQVINFLAKDYWSKGMASFHNQGSLFNMDISGGFPYLCASALVYADPGTIKFFPARPAQWTNGSLKGVRLRGGIVVRDLTWNGNNATAVLVSDTDQTVMIEQLGSKTMSCTLRGGAETRLNLQ